MPVSEDARFLALAPELAARIQAREFVLLSYMAVAPTLFSPALTHPDGAALALAIPYIALAISLIVTHHDLVVGVLSDFMRELSKNTVGPRLHHDAEFMDRVLRYR